MTAAEHPPEREYDLEALCSLDPAERDPVILQLSEDVTPRLRQKIRSILGHGVKDEVVEELMQEMWTRLLPRLQQMAPPNGLVGFVLTMQANIAQEHRRTWERSTSRLDSEAATNLMEGARGGAVPTPSFVAGGKEIRKAAAKDLGEFRASLEIDAAAPPPPHSVDRPVLQLLALDALLSEGGHSQRLFLERDFSPTEASRLRRKALERLGNSIGRLRSFLGDHVSDEAEPEAFSRNALAPGSVLSDTWDLLGIACHRHPPVPFASAHPGHESDVQWLREVHVARCAACASQGRGTAAEGQRAVDTVTRSLGL